MKPLLVIGGAGLAYVLGLLCVWMMGAAERHEQVQLQRLRNSASLEDWQHFLAAHPHSHEAHAWVEYLEKPPAQPPEPPLAAQESPSREAQLRSEIAQLEARFTVLYQQATVTKRAEQEAIDRTPLARAPVAPLPAHPDAAAVDAYLLAVQKRLAPVTRFRADDEDVALIMVVPPTHLDQLLEAAIASRSSLFRSLVGRALPDLATSKQQDLILAWLPRLPELIAVVERQGWQTEALPIIRSGIANGSNMEIQVEWMRMLVAAADPADVVLIQNAILANRYGYWRRDLCREVERFPGFPIRETVERCWMDNKTTNGAAAFLPVAAEYGVYDALVRIVACLDRREDHFSSEAAATWLEAHTDVPDDAPSRKRWLGTATDMPAFDPTTCLLYTSPSPRDH
jgi:hypothetical protein